MMALIGKTPQLHLLVQIKLKPKITDNGHVSLTYNRKKECRPTHCINHIKVWKLISYTNILCVQLIYVYVDAALLRTNK